MILLILLAALSLWLIVAAVRDVFHDGYRRLPSRPGQEADARYR